MNNNKKCSLRSFSSLMFSLKQFFVAFTLEATKCTAYGYLARTHTHTQSQTLSRSNWRVYATESQQKLLRTHSVSSKEVYFLSRKKHGCEKFIRMGKITSITYVYRFNRDCRAILSNCWQSKDNEAGKIWEFILLSRFRKKHVSRF